MNDIKVLNHAADNIRILAASMVEKAKSGHPGGAMGGADFIKDLVQRMDFIYEPRKVITIFNVLMSLRTIIVLGGLLTWLFFRIKTLKH